jgi:DNA-binding transcriptional ArsR family regulator
VDKDTLQSQACAEQLKALSEPIRLRIVDLLRQSPLAVSDIAGLLDVEMVTVSHHLGILKHADIVEAEREGRFMIYRLRDDLLQKAGGANSKQFLNLGCCRLEIPKEA